MWTGMFGAALVDSSTALPARTGGEVAWEAGLAWLSQNTPLDELGLIEGKWRAPGVMKKAGGAASKGLI